MTDLSGLRIPALLIAGMIAASLGCAACSALQDPATMSFVSSDSASDLLIRYSPSAPDGAQVVFELPAGAQGTGLLSRVAWSGSLDVLTRDCVVLGSLRIRSGGLNFAVVSQDGQPVEVTSADVLDTESDVSLKAVSGACGSG